MKRLLIGKLSNPNKMYFLKESKPEYFLQYRGMIPLSVHMPNTCLDVS